MHVLVDFADYAADRGLFVEGGDDDQQGVGCAGKDHKAAILLALIA